MRNSKKIEELETVIETAFAGMINQLEACESYQKKVVEYQEEIVWLKALLYQRDAWIVSKGLWNEFVDSLPDKKVAK